MGAELVGKVHDLLSAVEQLHGQKQFNGDTDRLFTIVETCASKRPVSSIIQQMLIFVYYACLRNIQKI